MEGIILRVSLESGMVWHHIQCLQTTLLKTCYKLDNMGSCSMLKRSLGIIDEVKEEIVRDDNQTNCLHKDTICQDNLCFYKQQVLMTNNGMLDCLPNGMITIHNL